MDQGRIDAVLSGDVARRMLTGRSLARLAYTARDGTPRVVPVGFWWDGAAMVVCTATNAAKVPAIRAAPAVAVTIDTDEFPPRALLIRGRAEVEWVDGVPDEYLRANHAAIMTPDQRREWERGVRDMYDAMERIRIRPTWAKLLDFETTLPSAIEELVARRAAGSGAAH